VALGCLTMLIAMSAMSAVFVAIQRQYANPLLLEPMTLAEVFPVGVPVSLVSAALLRNSQLIRLGMYSTSDHRPVSDSCCYASGPACRPCHTERNHLQTRVSGSLPDTLIARVDRYDASARLFHVLGREVAGPVPLRRQADHSYGVCWV
jgi:hypothetical protein